MDTWRKQEKAASGKTVTQSKRNSLFLGLLGLILLLAADQLTKWLAYEILRPQGPVVQLPGIFELHYLENQGAAFGMMENMQWIFFCKGKRKTTGGYHWEYVRGNDSNE